MRVCARVSLRCAFVGRRRKQHMQPSPIRFNIEAGQATGRHTRVRSGEQPGIVSTNQTAEEREKTTNSRIFRYKNYNPYCGV